MAKNKKTKILSELRFDLISNDWVVIAKGRSSRPEVFGKKEKCPFCKLDFKGKSVKVIPNKYPAFSVSGKLERKREGGLYESFNAYGFHEVVVLKDHGKDLAEISEKEMKELIEVYKERYLALLSEKLVNHIAIFHNQGKGAGASISHAHSQIATTPFIDINLKTSLSNAESHFLNTGKCIYCQMIEWEKKSKKRIVFENSEFVALCPFAPKAAFEVVISPKKHLPYFEKINQAEITGLAEAFQAVLKKIKKGLNNPDYNFYLHTAPCDKRERFFYHWHWTIMPKTANWAGFELGSQMEITTIEPEKAAAHLRKQ
ncbi:MAG: HIT domain-containing protein [Candidatus Pacebacteria bacterium]|nr:HIT domain-containing protein [Candidatus Paceibacterota bacterium]